MGDDTEWIKLPTDEKCVHKAWKARIAGYEEATKLFNTLGDEKSPEFSKYLGIMKKLVTDNNAIAQEKALDVILAYVENAAVAGRTTQEVVGGVVTKCLNASRAKTKEKGMEIIMMYIEIEKQEMVQEELMKGLTNKQPKVVAGCVQSLREALRDFGSKIITIKPLVKQLQRLLEDRDKTVREEGKQLAVEIFRWIGAPIRAQLTSLKPVQLTELEAEFENVGGTKPQQTRFLRSQQDLKAKMEAATEAGADVAGAAGPAAVEPDEEIDPYDLVDPVDIIPKIPKDFFEKVEAKKWQERREVLEVVQKLTENPKIEPGDFHDLVRALMRVVSKDANVMLVTIAVKCIGGLATGLRKKFSAYGSQCIDTMVEKFKEKKITVVTALRDACDAVYLTTSLDSISESIVGYMDHKTPTVKSETISFLGRCFTKCTPATLPKKHLKLFVTPLLKTINDTFPEVREASFVTLGTAMKVVGEKPLLPFISDIDPIKLAKVKECCEKAVVVGKRGGAPKAAPPPAAAAPTKKTDAKPTGVKKKPTGAGGADSASGASTKGRPKTAPAKGAKKGGKAPAKEEVEERLLSDEAVDEKMADLFPGDTVAGLANSNWKERLASMEKMAQVLKAMSSNEIPTQACVRTIAKKPGLKDNNFQVMKMRIDLISHLAKNSAFSKQTAECVLPDLTDKIGDVKNGAGIKEALTNIAEATSLQHISVQVLYTAFEQKNPKTHAEALIWLAGAIRDFGFKVPVKPIIESIKKAIAATNPAVRIAAIAVLSIMYQYMGEPLRMLFEGEKAALLQQINAEFDKVKGEKPPTPTRGIVAGEAGGAEGEDGEDEEDEAGGGGGGGAASVADLIPRNDISEQIKDDIIDNMADKNWKIRKEALDKVVTILNEAKFITPNIGPLPESLKLRLADSNKILMSTALSICKTLATAIGPNIRQHVRVIGPGLLPSLGDNKPQVRAVALGALNAWVEQGGIKEFVESEQFSDELKKENPMLRTELLGWLAEKLPEQKKLPKEELGLCVPHLFTCLEDRSADVRKKAHEAVMPFMIHLGYESMLRQGNKVKTSSKEAVLKALEAARVTLPAKPVKAPKAAAPAKAKAAVASSPVDDYEDEEVDRPATAPSKPQGKPKSKLGAKKPVAAAAKKKEVDDDDAGPILKVSKGKEKRFKDEKTMKTLKWNFTTPQPEFVDQLKNQMEPTFSKAFMEQIFHTDFKQHVKALEALMKTCEDSPEVIVANNDLILKWCTLRFFDTNTSMLLKMLEFLNTVFTMLAQMDYHLHDLEAAGFIPYLINKVGDPKDLVRKDIRSLFKTICKVYPASKMFNFILDGLGSKNSKTRIECLEELGNLVEVYGINVCQPAPAQALKTIAGQISDRDNSVRSAALNTIVQAYHILGDQVYKFIGNLKDKDQGMLEERIKRSARSKVPQAPSPATPVSRKSPEENGKGPMKAQQPMPRPASNSRLSDSPPREEPKSRPSSVCLPQLIEIDLSYLDEPVRMPVRRSRPPSPSMKLFNSSADTRSTLDLVISQVGGNDVDVCLQALAQIDGVLNDPEKSLAMKPHVDQFLVVCSMQIRLCYNKHMLSADPNSKLNVIQLYKYLLAVMVALFQCPQLAKEASTDILKDLIKNLIIIMLDTNLNELEEGPQVIRSVNIMVVKIVEKCDFTTVMSALIKLLGESVGTESVTPTFLEILMKCLWRMVRIMPGVINDLNADRIVGDLHLFLQRFPTHTWKKQNDTPLRTIKTILHTLAKLKGEKIFDHLSQVPGEGTEVHIYISKMVSRPAEKNSNDKENDSMKPEQMNGNSDADNKQTREQAKARRVSKTANDMLAEIFKKIGNKENAKEGLNELYDFKQKYPKVDLTPFFKKSSQFFQSYIERGLKSIESERENSDKPTGMNIPTCTNPGDIPPEHSCQTAAEFMGWLQAMRSRCGLPNDAQSTANNNNQTPEATLQSAALLAARLKSVSDSKEESKEDYDAVQNQDEENSDPAASQVDMAALKQRLAQIKRATNGKEMYK